jgi:sirohydrochlorin ferrochelatase
MTENEIVKPKVILVDHGSPQAAVAEVRDHLGEQVNALLKDEISLLGVASMERRPGPQYAFNDPLLSVALTSVPFSEGDVVVLLQFLSPGRHAGPSGDIAEICQEASRGRRQLNTYITDPIGNDPRVVDVLIQRYEEVVRAAFAARSNPPPAHSA